MPTYSYECEVCEHRTDLISTIHQVHRDVIKCERCGMSAPRDYGSIQVRNEFWPFVTSNITGSPVEITSQRQRDDLCRRTGNVPIEPGMKAKKQESKLPSLRDDYEKVCAQIENKEIDVSALAAEIGETL